jgi:hypothetical protein
LTKKSGNPEDLIYLDRQDEMIKKILG